MMLSSLHVVSLSLESLKAIFKEAKLYQRKDYSSVNAVRLEIGGPGNSLATEQCGKYLNKSTICY